MKYSEYQSDKYDADSIEMFIDNVISGSGEFSKLDSHPTFQYQTDDL